MIAETAIRDVVLYDGQCGLCSGWVRVWIGLLGAHGIGVAPLQTPGVAEKIGVRDETELLSEFRLLAADGSVHSGVDVYLFVGRKIAWARPLAWLGALPGIYHLMRAGYGFFRRNRYAISKHCGLRCELPPRPQGPRGRAADAHGEADAGVRSAPAAFARSAAAWLPLLILPMAVASLAHALPPWAFMWLLAFALYAGCKWLTWRKACDAGVRAWPERHLAYLFAWPGMNARTFLAGREDLAVSERAWRAAIFKTLLGAVFVWVLARAVEPRNLTLAAWLGMTGAILILHFGLFHVLALAWQSAHVPAPPIMRAPLLARSLGDFWSARWNLAMRDLVHAYVLAPLRRRVGVPLATMSVFLLSGLIHELVISVPARAGYGLPTAYFTLQGAGVLFERSHAGRALGLAHGWRGRCFALGVTALPVFALFHPPFVEAVIVPFMRALGAL
ncbi:MAG: DUF393 domain-containing protein [Planctomycetota bacterium]|nr:DUF393 domain-containing protein [Planctomycetota bacterium]